MSANVVRDPKLEARDKWIYKSVCNVAMQLGEIKGNLRIKIGSQKPGKRWSMITSVQGIRRAANKYAERNHLDAPPSRKNK